MRTRLGQILSVMFVLASGPASGRNSDQEIAMFAAEAKSSLLTYKDCMTTAATVYASADATPSEVSDAAQSKCSVEFRAYQDALRGYFSSMVSRSAALMAQDQAEAHSNEIKAAAKEMVIRLVVESRLHL